ncbi:hypothetical protein [Sphingobium sp. LF-16]|uniref:hypothetical protein n=1 Tax=Sphingobium sp. LF-16 TaxID=2185111 RepID=UPI000F07A6E2|nr:hypothetical protein [Sphingobium sp. LF-16]
MASHDDDRLCHLDGQTWWPVIAKLPTLRYDFFDGSFDGGSITSPSGTLEANIEAIPSLPRLAIHDARIRIWGGELGDAFSSFVLTFDGRVKEQPSVDGGAMSISFGADDSWLDQPMLATYAGTGGAEGGTDLEGQVKTLALGAPRFVPATLVDAVDNIYQLSGYGTLNGFEVAFERLNRFGAPSANAASFAALKSGAVTRGQWATCRALGFVKFGAPPEGLLSFHIQGDAVGGWSRLPGDIIRRIATIAGGAARLSAADVAALNTARPWPLSIVVNAQTTARELIQRVAMSVNAVAYVDWLGVLRLSAIGIGVASMTIAADGSSLPPVADVQQVETSAPYWKIAQGAAVTWQVHGLNDIAFSAPLNPRGPYDPDETYREGDMVTLPNGSQWLFIGTTPAKGSVPADNNPNWFRLSDAITAGNITYEDGTPVEELKPAQPGATNGASAAEKDQLAQLATDTAAAKVRIAQAEQDIEDLFETYGDSASAAASAAAAANSASAAQGYASTASSASANAGAARDQAQAAQGAAASSATAAANAKTDAEAAFASSVTARNAAQAAQSASETARNQAQTYASNASGSATAAAGSATTASTAATNAGNSATAAAASAVSASSSYDGARLAAVSTMPSDFINDGEFWSSIFYSGAGLAPKITADSTYSFPTVSGIGKVAQIVVGSSEVRLSQIGLINLVDGRRYRITAIARQTAGATGATLRLWRIGWQSGATTVGNSSANQVTASLNTWYTLQQEYNASTLIAAGAVGTRAMMGFTDAGTYQVQFIRLEDITESTAAATSSAAAATSASAAGQSATAAQNSATSANTSAGNASTSAGQASTSATNAAGSASAAQTSATNAAGSATAAGNSATAASSSASTASTKATEASQSASAAAGSATTASTKAGEASTSASQAAASVTTAAGHAATAQTQATNAANSATAAGNSASAASNSASTAQTAANNAGTYATAAQQSSVSATLAAAATLPIDFTQDGEFWTGNFNNTPPTTVSIAPSATFSFTDVSGVGRVMQVVGSTSNVHVSQRGWLKAVAGRTYRVAALIRVLSGTGGACSVFASAVKAEGGQASAWSTGQSAMTVGQWYEIARTVTGDMVLAAGAGTGAYLRTIVRMESAVTYQVAWVRVDDITESTAASGSATAAAASASAASASQTAAGNSASAAQTSATNAATSAGNASTFAGNASTSATNAATSASNAAGSASTASTQATNAANSATAAGNSATAAAGSASTASTQATNAGNSASAAAASAVSASSSYDDSRLTVASQMPSSFQRGGEYWTPSYFTGAGIGAKITPNAVYSFPTVAGEGVVAQIEVTSGDVNIAHIGLIPLVANRTFQLTARARKIAGATGGTMRLWRIGWQSGNTTVSNNNVSRTADVLNTWYDWSWEFSSNTPIASGAVGVRAMMTFLSSSPGTYQVSLIRLEDITESTAAAGSASAAASSASSASTSATNAANSASAASSSATTASTQAGNASSSASSASTSAANASSSATNAANSATSASGYANTAQTKAGEASASASAASSSASAASASASSAQTSATNASTYAGQAQSSATAASTSATVASDAAAAAQTSATVSAQVAAASINPNPVFAAWPTGSTYPTGYTANGTAPTISKPTGKQSPYALGTTLNSSTASSIGVRTSPVQDASVTLNSWIVLEVDAQIGSGTYQGAGVMFRIMDSSGTETVNYKVSLYSDPDIAGATGNASGVRRWRRLVQITGANPNGWQIFIFNRWSSLSGYTSSATSNYIEWSKVSFRPAYDSEIASKQATADIAALSATVTQQATTLATLTTQYANLSSTVSAQGASVSQQATAIASLEGNVTTLFAKWGLELDVNGYVSGMVTNNNGTRADMTLRMDKVKMVTPSGLGGYWQVTFDNQGRPTQTIGDDASGVMIELGYLS